MHNELVLLAFKKLNLIYMRRILLFTSFVLIAMTGALAQGVTTSSISGKATDQNGEALPGATVVDMN